MDDAAALLEIEAINQLKARYCRYLDAKDWETWRAIFTDDFLSDTSQAGGKVIRGADEFVAFTSKVTTCGTSRMIRSGPTIPRKIPLPTTARTPYDTSRARWSGLA